MTDIETALVEIQARADAATAGPWLTVIGESHGGEKKHGQWFVERPVIDEGGEETEAVVCRMCWPTSKRDGENTADFIAHARTDVPALLKALWHEHTRAESFRSELERLDPIVCPDDQESIRQIIEMPDCADILRT